MAATVPRDVEARIAVVGVGGAGCNMVSDIYWDLPSVDTIAVNTDKNALIETDADRKIFICKAVTKGEGTFGDSLLGKRCAQAHIEEIESVLNGYDVVYIVAGMGGGTGSGAAPIVAEIAQRVNCVVFSVIVNPFSFESSRLRIAKEGISNMRAVCPMTVVIENDLILEKMPELTMEEAFRAVNRSVASYIEKQQRKVEHSFRDHLSHIGDFVKEPKLPGTNIAKSGLASN